MNGFFHDSLGDFSMMRLGFAVSMVIGTIISLCGCVAMFINAEAASVAISSGSAMIVGSGFAKAVQSKYESYYD